MADKGKIKAIVAIVERGQGKPIAKHFEAGKIPVCLQCMGSGTASSELLDVLGFGTSERDVVIGLAQDGCVEQMLRRYDQELRGKIDAHGILFDLTLTGLNGRIATVLFHAGQNSGGNGGDTMQQTENSLILVTVNQGHTDAVMDTAREAGATGGTIIRARWAGAQEDEQLMGISIQAEKEIIAIVASTENRNTIMETINKKHGLNTQAGAMLCSLGIDYMVRG